MNDQFPTLPALSVVGRLGVLGDSGPSQSIPFATLARVLATGAAPINAFGAIAGINTADQKTANAAAILACMNANVSVIVPVGTFYTDPIVFPATLKSLVGAGHGCSILSGTPGSGISLLTNGGNSSNLIFADFGIEVPYATNADQGLSIQIAGTINTHFSGLRLSGRFGIYSSGNTNLTVENCFFDHWGSSAIFSTNTTGLTFSNNIVANTSNFGAAGAAVTITSVSGSNRNTRIQNNTIGQPPVGHFVVSISGDSDTLEITGNTLYATTAECINFDTNIGSVGIYRSVIDHNICVCPPSATITASIAGAVLTVSAIAHGSLSAGQALSPGSGAGTAIIPGTLVGNQLTGSAGSTGTYAVNISQTVGSESMVAGHDDFGMSFWAAVQPVRYLSLKNNVVTNPGSAGIVFLDDVQYSEIKNNLIITPHYANLVNSNPIVGYGIALANYSTLTGNTSHNTVVGNTIWDFNGFMTQTITEQANGGASPTGNVYRSNNGTAGPAGFYTGTAVSNVALSAAYEGGTGQGNYTIGDILAADTSLSLVRIPDVATGSALISGGVGVLPSWGKIGNSTLSNSSLTINGTLISLGGSATITAAAASATVGTTTIGGGTTTRVLFDNAGVLGEYTISGTGSVAMTTSPAFTTPNLGTPSAVTLTNGTGLPTTGLTGTLQAAQEPAHTGDVTNSAGSLALTLATAQPAVHTWALAQSYTVAPVFTDQSGSRTALGLGTASTQNTGTSGAAVPLLNGANTWSSGQTFSAAFTYGGVTLSNAVTGTGNMVLSTSPTLVTPALGTPASGVATNFTGTAAGLTAGNVTTNANLTGDITSVGNATTLTNAPVIAKVLTGYTSGAGTVSAADSILTAFQKLNGNDALKAPLASPPITGVLAVNGAMPNFFSYSLVGVNFNTTADQAIAIPLPTGFAHYRINNIVVSNPSTSLTTAAGGIYTAASKGGVAILSAGTVYSALTTNTAGASGSIFFPAPITNASTAYYNSTPLYFSLSTPQGSAATADITIFVFALP